MRNYIFTDRERSILEAYLIKADIDKITLAKILKRMKKQQTLFEDIFLYLQVRKTITT